MTSSYETCSLDVLVASHYDAYQLAGQMGTIFPFQFYPASGDFIVYMAAASWLLCDYVDTIRDEVTYVWKQPMCLGSFLFFALRYLGIISVLSGLAIATWPRPVYLVPTCAPVYLGYDIQKVELWNLDVDCLTYWLAPALQFLVFWLVEVVMQMRIFALYNSRLLAMVNATLFFTEIAVMLYLWHASPYLVGPIVSEFSRSVATQYTLRAGGSLLDAYADPWPIYWFPALAFELLMAGLAIAKLRKKTLKHGLINVVLRDSLMYFIMCAVFMIVHIVLGTHRMGGYAAPFMVVGETIAGSRLVLHLRKAYFRGRALGTTGQTAAPPAMHVHVSETKSRRVIDETFYDSDPAGQGGFDYVSLAARMRAVPGA